MHYELVFTQSVDGCFVNHKNIAIPTENSKVKHEVYDKSIYGSYQEYLKLSKEIEESVAKFKMEQANFERKKKRTQLKTMSILKELTELALTKIENLQIA